ncbi:signal recognition particle receptor [Klebsormidium nitens]|uniref:Signal recognition particle receptor n=1 Tax=Klebsormidium nitens TaxID=105231 RepID=A0A1Y1IH64_KLENI|nr:signal recognition particle receptor [Klebsormidium nitens]|eukprot:GAQ87478.1 signal recognition particle receptor [Klebsormidium nitens]
MLDHFSIFTRGGLVLWTFQLTSALKGNPVDSLIRSCLLEERSGETSFSQGEYTLKWTFHNELGLVFVAVYQRILQLLYVEELLAAVKAEFAPTYKEGKYSYKGFDDKFQRMLQAAETRAEESRRSKQITKFENTKKGKDKLKQTGKTGGNKTSGGKQEKESDDDDSSSAAEKNKLGVQAVKSDDSRGNSSEEESVGTVSNGANGATAFDLSKLQKRKGKGPSTKKADPLKPADGKKLGSDSAADSGKKGTRGKRVWDDTPDPNRKLDYSEGTESEVIDAIDVSGGGKSRMDVEEDLDDDEEEGEEEEQLNEVSNGTVTATTKTPAKKGWFASVFQSVAGKAALEKEDLEPALKALKERLMTKNVAEEIAEKLCESVATSIVGRKQASFSLVSSTVKAAMEEALLRILTPKRSIDILRDVHAAKEAGRPYTVVFVGVNGVGKSTNLSKVAYWLLQHDINVMIAACDTFRSGAVEQLKTHCRRLNIPLFERGYEKDPAAVAADAIRAAAREKRDVVLVDTAGRMQDNEPLMRSLSKLINQNQPDLVLFVGEALVGNDGVDQLMKFNQRLADLSVGSAPRLIDGILLTKFDTIDDKVGAALSMVYVSSAPIMFVGCGQTYTDLTKLNVKQIVRTLLK